MSLYMHDDYHAVIIGSILLAEQTLTGDFEIPTVDKQHKSVVLYYALP